MVAASAEAAYRAVRQVRSEEIELMGPLFFVRRLPERMRAALSPAGGRSPDPPLEPSPQFLSAPWVPRILTRFPSNPPIEQTWRQWSPAGTLIGDALRGGFVLLAEEPGSEIVLGLVGRFWAFFGSPPVSIASPRDFLAFGEPGYARTVWNFRVEASERPGYSRVSTETRVWAIDTAARLRLLAYWASIYPGSALIRRMMLRAVRKRAEGD
jgi:hypothetical protein